LLLASRSTGYVEYLLINGKYSDNFLSCYNISNNSFAFVSWSYFSAVKIISSGFSAPYVIYYELILSKSCVPIATNDLLRPKLKCNLS